MKKGVIILLVILLSVNFISASNYSLIHSWGFENNLNVKAVSKGNYSVYLSFEVKRQKFEGNWEFKVV
ncbi:MAG: hypothetical protein AABW90_01645 [Nanoarchaeota archaeon]